MTSGQTQMCHERNTHVHWTFQTMIFAKNMKNLITKTLQSWRGPQDHNFLQLFQVLFTRLRIYNAVDNRDRDSTSIKKILCPKISK